MRMLRLALFFLCAGLVVSRAGLLVHEGLGHGGVALALGGSVREVTLFWFGGGWVRTFTPPGDLRLLAVQLAGIGAELLVAAALGLLAHRWAGQQRARLAQLGAVLFTAHALWYAATGIWHGFGDGAFLHERLGQLRYPVALALGAALCAVALLATRRLCRVLAPSLRGPWPSRLAAVLAAAALAGGAHAALAYGELALRQDETYRLTMRTAEQRLEDERLAAWRAELARRGAILIRQEDLLRAQKLAPPRPFPFARVLAAVALAAVVLGAWSLRRSEPGTPGTSSSELRAPLSNAALAWAAVAAFAAVSVVALAGL